MKKKRVCKDCGVNQQCDDLRYQDAELCDLRLKLSGRTYCHSDDAVKAELEEVKFDRKKYIKLWGAQCHIALEMSQENEAVKEENSDLRKRNKANNELINLQSIAIKKAHASGKREGMKAAANIVSDIISKGSLRADEICAAIRKAAQGVK